METSRERNFKIARLHGKIDPRPDSEAKIRNDIYMVGMLELMLAKDKSIKIRLFAYETPIKSNAKRTECIDLLGYDQNHKPYIVELKKPNSNEKLDKVFDQLHRYSEQFALIKEYIQAEVQEQYYWKDFKFSGDVGKIILSGRNYYKSHKKLPKFNDIKVYICSFSGIKEDFGDLKLLKKFGSKGVIRLKVENK